MNLFNRKLILPVDVMITIAIAIAINIVVVVLGYYLVMVWDLYGTAGSTGRRNTGVESLCWGFKLQGLTWSFV